MKLGLLTAPFAETPLGEVANWAHQAGFEALEIACWPKTSGATRRYAGTSHIDAASTSPQEAKAMCWMSYEGKTAPRGFSPSLQGLRGRRPPENFGFSCVHKFPYFRPFSGPQKKDLVLGGS